MTSTVLKLNPAHYDAYMITWCWPGNHLYITDSILSYKEKETIEYVINSLSEELGITEVSIVHTETVAADRRFSTLLKEWETFIVREEGERWTQLDRIVRDTLRAREAPQTASVPVARIHAL
ncbi:hypothetical protein [Nisaea nitritireducens]|uniref:hypothetical protein n=1 Tax=Nisaea nitritireducens TaxID=568392 RepID=UPI0018670E90|nr:hypothetical protein [Nisaea nitritireducens]|tara:strand:+ start:2579 stop:2944 length:366 start_codon:yes stop_codon:yes gene_type:complete